MADSSSMAAPPLKSEPLSPAYRRYALFILFVVFTLNFVDRQIINILAELIKRELGIADWQIGLLTGLSFAVFYATLALPIARWAERGDRVKIVAGSAIVWSFFTAVCGLAQTFSQLFLARIGVGVGEAGCTPASHSLISDYTTKDKRASALAIFSMGIPVGSLVGMAVGGLIADSFGWRAAFALVGLPGIAIGILTYLTLPEPRRAAQGDAKAQQPPPLPEALAELKNNRTYIFLTMAMALMSFVGFGQLAFHSSFFLRNHIEDLAALTTAVNAALGITLGSTGFLGTALGLIIGIFGAIGTWLGGAISDRAARQDARAYMTLPAITAGVLPFTIVATYLAPGALAALILLGMPMLLHSMYYGPVFASVQSLVQPRTRATAAAVFFFFANLIGLGLGPLTVGAVSDILSADIGSGDGIRWSLILTSFGYFGAAACFLIARRTIRDDIVS